MRKRAEPSRPLSDSELRDIAAASASSAGPGMDLASLNIQRSPSSGSKTLRRTSQFLPEIDDEVIV